MKKVSVQVVQHLAPGGIECLVLELQRLAGEEYDVHIVSLEGETHNKLQEWTKLQGISSKIHFLHKKPGIQASTLWELVTLLKKLNASVVHTHHIGPLLYGGIAARIVGIKNVIHTEHDAWHLQNLKRRILQKIALVFIRPILVADAEMVASEMKRLLHNVKPLIIPNGIDIDRFKPGNKLLAREKLGIDKNLLTIGCAARLVPEKAHSNLLEAFAKLSSNSQLLLAGDGPLKSGLLMLAKQIGIDKRVHFLGNTDDMTTFYQALDVFCLASTNEGMPLSPLEAQACGIPVVVTKVGGTAEVVCPETGILIESNNIEELVQGLKYQITNNHRKSPRDFVVMNANIHNTVANYQHLTAVNIRG